MNVRIFRFFQSGPQEKDCIRGLCGNIQGKMNNPTNTKTARHVHMCVLERDLITSPNKVIQRKFNISENLKANVIFGQRPEQLSVSHFIELTHLIQTDQKQG